jgi:capsular polysaccharide export protein
VHKVNFNAGDWFFYPLNAVNYRGDAEAWPVFFEHLLVELRIDAVMLFGDCRYLHAVARSIARARKVETWVFEEGYVRPDFITMERDGTNAYSSVPRRSDFYRGMHEVPMREVRPVGKTFRYAAGWALMYYLAANAGTLLFPRYRHHRSLSIGQGLFWVAAGWRKLLYSIKERNVLSYLRGQKSKRFFLMPLQTEIDAQMRIHSRFDSVEDFMEEVVASFSRHSSPEYLLVIKHHPLDRGYNDYSSFIKKIGSKYGVTDKLIYIHDQHLPTLLNHAAGLVVVNSTVGLSGIHHGVPLKVLGKAIYDFDGLTFQGELTRFWSEAAAFTPDMSLYHRFRTFLIQHTQLNGNFYSGSVADISSVACGGSYGFHDSRNWGRDSVIATERAVEQNSAEI